MTVSPCTALCAAYARASPRHASTWSFRRATGAQRLSSAGTLVRVVEPLVKARVSKGRKAAFEHLSSSCEIEKPRTDYTLRRLGPHHRSTVWTGEQEPGFPGNVRPHEPRVGLHQNVVVLFNVFKKFGS